MYRIAWCVLLLAVVGCSSDRTPTAPVSGTVTLDGKMIEKGKIVFESSGNRPATGQIENGQIVGMTTYEPDDGVPVGHHQVAVYVVEEGASAIAATPDEGGDFDPNYMGGKSLIPEKYGDPATSGLTADVAKGDENQVEFKLLSGG